MVIPEGDFGSDVEGTKPLFFDVGDKDEGKVIEALEHCRKHLGDNVTILYDNFLPSIEKMAKKQGKEAGGPWDCYHAENFHGWEAERVVAVEIGYYIMEMITRARTHLAIVFVGGKDSENKKHFEQAANENLVEIVHLSAN